MPGKEQFHGKSRGLQMVAHQAGNIGIVFDHKNAGFHMPIVAGVPKSCADCNQIETIGFAKPEALWLFDLDQQIAMTIKPKTLASRDHGSRAVFSDDGRPS